MIKSWAVCLWLALLGGILPSQAAYYQVGQVITNFTVYMRRAWTDPTAGKTFDPELPIRLNDFAGKVLFVEFFDPT